MKKPSNIPLPLSTIGYEVNNGGLGSRLEQWFIPGLLALFACGLLAVAANAAPLIIEALKQTP